MQEFCRSRVGSRMIDIAAVVTRHPGMTAYGIGPRSYHGAQSWVPGRGRPTYFAVYSAVERTLAAGMIRVETDAKCVRRYYAVAP